MEAGEYMGIDAEQARLAATWLTRLECSPGNLTVQEEFVAWLKADPGNLRQFLEMQALDVELRRYMP